MDNDKSDAEQFRNVVAAMESKDWPRAIALLEACVRFAPDNVFYRQLLRSLKLNRSLDTNNFGLN